MAKEKSGGAGFFAKFGLGAKAWTAQNVEPAQEITQGNTYLYGAGTTTVASLLGYGRNSARARQLIYRKWMLMEGDAIVSAACRLLVTAALGGHETNGDMVFIEPTPDAKKNKRLSEVVEDITKTLSRKLNRIAFQMAYTGVIYGDSYARIYWQDKEGVVDIESDEMVRPQLIQPFEQGGRTIGYAVSLGEQNFERMDITQIARLKMARTQWIPQHGVVEKSYKCEITNNDEFSLPVMPSMVGGSLLYNAEVPYDNLVASILGMVGQRWIDSIDEQMITVNMESMNIDQQKKFLESMKQMLLRSKEYAEQAVVGGHPIMERVRHIVPVYQEKQLMQIQPVNAGGSGRAANISIDDIMFHARLLAGALGVDLSMLGFADQLAGGLGEGGFFRTSAQAAENGRIIRNALTDFFNSIIDIHTLKKYGVVFNEGDRPWTINFYGTISALESERQRTKGDAMNAGAILVQTIQQLKELGATREIAEEFLTKQMQLDADEAKLYAGVVETAGGDDAGGGFGGGNDSAFGDEPPRMPEKSEPRIRRKKEPIIEEHDTDAEA